MNNKAKYAITGAAALLVGIGLGNVSAVEQPASEAKPSPTITTTVTPPPKVVTKTETKEVTPRACTSALDAAERVVKHAQEGFNIAADYVPLIPAAAQAGAELDSNAMEDINSKMASLNKKLEDLTPKVREDVEAYNRYADQCKE